MSFFTEKSKCGAPMIVDDILQQKLNNNMPPIKYLQGMSH